LFRGGTAMGVRGVIDPFDPDNPYGPKISKDSNSIVMKN